MTQPLTPAQEAAAYYQSQMSSQAPPVPLPVTMANAAPPPAQTPPTVSQLQDAYKHGHISFQQYHQALQTATPDPVAPAFSGPISAQQQIQDDAKHGRISYQQELAAMRNPGAYTGPPGSQPAAAAQAAAPAPKSLTPAPAAGANSGAAEQQGQQPPDLVAPFLRPGGAAGVAAHPVGYSPADKTMLGAMGAEQQYAGQNAEDTAGKIQSTADTLKNQMDALAAESKQGALDYQNHLNDQQEKRQQLNSDSNAAQRRIDSQLSDLQAQNIDPNKYFHDQSTGQNLLGAILVGLGGFGSHALGPNGHDSTNTALEMMNSSIQREVDAQKTNLQKSLSVLGQRMNLNAQGFDQQKALLEAERESTQTAYQIAQNEIARRAAQFKDNADVQMNASKLIGGMRDSAANRIGELNGQIYQVQKAGEKIVGGGAANTIDPEKFDKLVADHMKEQSDAGVPPEQNTIAAAHAFILARRYGITTPGADMSLAPKPTKGAAGGLASARVARMVGPHMNNEQKLDRLNAILNRSTLGFLGSQDLAEAQQLHAQLTADHVAGLPNIGRFSVGRMTGSEQAAVRSAGAGEKGAVKTYQGLIANGAGSPDEGEVPNIEGVDKEEPQ